MEAPELVVRRANVDDLPGLKQLWEHARFQVLDVEKQLTEFQVVTTPAGDLLGAMALQIQDKQGCLHHEAFVRPERADDTLDESLRSRNRRARVEVSGHTDADGSDSINGTLSRARADAVLRRLNPQRFSAIEFSAVGMGSTAPIGVGTTGQEKEQNRRVSLRTQLLDAAGGGGER